ncbi:hypothetical protein DYBT9275_02793 [Dyadobacter sp. CECT 9275]|uniref:Core-binding (CB) domain-containing protein n=1 Tax=Dyadobacter helix TaxID=2822344 RepID=A0A916N4R8_9BACT|nr:phage integrase SAM-like domain-containing protein [Dyadobacter sp. CECT 9275]CAG5002047.1 hypothetical protein DYBT9275_02793 [Dyadobacter sp. CECT 9275]
MRIRFVIRKARINSIGTCPVNCRITINGIKANEFAVGVSIEPEKWDSKKQRVKGTTQRVQDINMKLEMIRSELNEIYLAARSKGKYLNANEVREIYLGIKEVSCKLSKMGELFLSELKSKDRAAATIDRYTRCFRYLQEYIKKDQDVESIERRHITGFWKWLRAREFHTDYCNKIVQACIGLFRFGEREGYVESNPFKGISLEWKKELDITCLDQHEIQLLKTHNWSDRLQKVVDSFLFMCYTGLHIGDYINASDASRYTFGGREWMKIKRIKTKEEAIFIIDGYPAYLIEKYGGVNNLPKISGQKSNDYLKLIAAAVGIKKNLTNKIARKTFTDICINEYKLSYETVAKMLGHTSTRQVKHYGSVNEKRILSEWNSRVDS